MSDVNKSVYSLSSSASNVLVLTPDQIPICTNTPGSNLTALQMKSYIDRANALLATLVFTRSPVDTTLQRLDVIRQELCILTGQTYRPLPPPPEVGVTRTENGKLTMETVFQ
jgi:hypothetical protein